MRETFPHLGKVFSHFIPEATTPAMLRRQRHVMHLFQAAVDHYQEPYLAYQRVKTDRAREVVGLPSIVDCYGQEHPLEATGWEGYFVGCRRSDGAPMEAVDVVQTIAEYGLKLSRELRVRGYAHDEAYRAVSFASTLHQVIQGEAYDDIEALREVNEVYGALLGRLRAEVYHHRSVTQDTNAIQRVLTIYLKTGSYPVPVDEDVERDIAQYARFREETRASLMSIPPISYRLDGDTMTTTCVLPAPAERAPDGEAFHRYRISLTLEAYEGHQFAARIGRMGNPVVRAVLALLG